MTTLDIRNATFESLQKSLNARCLQVLAALRVHGPCTTAALAEKSGIAVLHVRPRITDLLGMGFVVLATAKRGREGVYLALSDAEALVSFRQRQATLTSGQLQLF